MGNGYKAPKEGAAALAAELRRSRQQSAATRGAAGILSGVIGKGGLSIKDAGQLMMFDEQDRAVLGLLYGGLDMMDPDTQGRMLLRNGRIYLWDQYNDGGATAGQIMTDQGAGINYMRLFPPHSSGSGLENSITVQGRRESDPGNMWFYTDGNALLQAGEIVGIQGERVQINPTDGVLTIYNLPSTGGGYALRYAEVGGEWTMALDSSSERRKTDDSPADDVANQVLQWQVRRFRYKAEVEQLGDDAPWHLGFFAEQIDEHTPEVVVRDSEGRPDALQHDRMIAPVVALVQRQQEQIAELTARLDALEGR